MRLLAAIVEGGVRHVGARRHRALDDVEGRLEGRVSRWPRPSSSCALLLSSPTLNITNWSELKVTDALRAREADADEVRARLLAGLEELALGPVAHELHAGLAFDDHGGGEVPVAAGEVVVDIGTQLGHAVEGFVHLVAAERRRVEVDHRRLVEVGAERQARRRRRSSRPARAGRHGRAA